MYNEKARSGLKKFREILNRISRPDSRVFPFKMIRTVLEFFYVEYLQDNYPNFEARYEDLNQLANYSLQYNSTEKFLSELILLTELSSEQRVTEVEDHEKVTLSSIHQAKGLEWKVIFVIWCLDGRFPSSRNIDTPEGEEEERRLFYVAATRAMDELYLCYPLTESRRSYQVIITEPSRFIRELDEETYEKWVVR